MSGVSTWLPPRPLPFDSGDAGRITQPVLAAVADTVKHAQHLDDQHGGAARRYVGGQATIVERMLRHDTYDHVTGRLLSTYLAQLCQTAAFMGHDAGADDQARTWYEYGLSAAHAAGDRPLTAGILSLMSNQAAIRKRPAEALDLAHAAIKAAVGAPDLVRALIAARSGLAYAAAADLPGFLRAREQTEVFLERGTDHPEPLPSWAYYVSTTELDAITGRGMVTLARRLPRHQARLLPEAETLLRGRVVAEEHDYDRSALRHSAWLALAYTQAGNPAQAVTAGHHAIALLRTVCSSRSLDLLRILRADLAAYRNEPGVHGLTTALDIHLSDIGVRTGRAGFVSRLSRIGQGIGSTGTSYPV